jgi:hypothetical protein
MMLFQLAFRISLIYVSRDAFFVESDIGQKYQAVMVRSYLAANVNRKG